MATWLLGLNDTLYMTSDMTESLRRNETKRKRNENDTDIRVGSLNHVPSQVRTIVAPEVPSSRRWDGGCGN